jgi:hypothetical protein
MCIDLIGLVLVLVDRLKSLKEWESTRNSAITNSSADIIFKAIVTNTFGCIFLLGKIFYQKFGYNRKHSCTLDIFLVSKNQELQEKK